MKDFNFGFAQSTTCGFGALAQLPSLMQKNLPGTCIVISDPGLVQLGLVEKVEALLKTGGIRTVPFCEVEANPSIETVQRATELYKEAGASSIVALGGGSPMDVAKAVGLLATYEGELRQYAGSGLVPGKITPLVAIPTTAGTGSEATVYSVVTDIKRELKMTISSPFLVPQWVLLDPELITSLPASIAAFTGVDALVHAIEAYVSLAASPFSDAMAEKALELLGQNIQDFVSCRQNGEAASAMLVGSNLAGIAFSCAKLGNIHAMSHPVSAYFHTPHGLANAILMPYVLEYNAPECHERYKEIYERIFPKKSTQAFTAEQLILDIKQLLKQLSIPEGLCEVGVTQDKIKKMAEDAMQSGNIPVNPRKTTRVDIEQLYHSAM